MESEDQGRANPRTIDARIRVIADNKHVLLESLDVNPVLLRELLGQGILNEFTKQHITSEKTYGINERFIDWLKTLAPQKIDIVLGKLREDKQGHVANLIDGTEGEKPLSTKVKQQIIKLSKWLTENLTTDHGLIDELYTRGAINYRDREDIKCQRTESARAMKLIDVILRGSDRTLKILLEALVASNQKHVAQMIEEGLPILEIDYRETENNRTREQRLILPEQSHGVRSEEVLCAPSSESDRENGKSLRAKTDISQTVDLCKMKGSEGTDNTDNAEMNDNMQESNIKAEQGKPEKHVGLAVVDKVETADPAIQEFQLKLKLLGKDLDRKVNEITRLQDRLRIVEEEKDEISKDLNEILELNIGDRDRMMIDLKKKVRDAEKEKAQLNNDLKEAIIAEEQTKKQYRDLQEKYTSCEQGHNRNTSLLGIINDLKDEAAAADDTAWSELKNCIVLTTEVTLNGRNVRLFPTLLLMLRNTKSPKETICSMIVFSLFFIPPLFLHLPIGIPDVISSFCFHKSSIIFCGNVTLAWVSALIADRQYFWRKLLALVGFLCYFSSGRFGPGVGVGRYCEEDKCVYLLCWEYLSNNMRLRGEAIDHIPNEYYDGQGGLFTSSADFAVWSKYTSHRWDKEMHEYTQDSRFIRKVYTKPLLGTAPFHYLTTFRLRNGLVSAGHGSNFYDDPMLKLCLLDTNGNIIKSFGGQFGSSKGVPIVLDADREGCLIVADLESGKMMTLCSDIEHMIQLRHMVREPIIRLEICLQSLN